MVLEQLAQQDQVGDHHMRLRGRHAWSREKMAMRPAWSPSSLAIRFASNAMPAADAESGDGSVLVSMEYRLMFIGKLGSGRRCVDRICRGHLYSRCMPKRISMKSTLEPQSVLKTVGIRGRKPRVCAGCKHHASHNWWRVSPGLVATAHARPPAWKFTRRYHHEHAALVAGSSPCFSAGRGNQGVASHASSR